MVQITQYVRRFIAGKGSIADFGDRYPSLDGDHMSSIEGLFVVGNIAGTPDIRSALNAGSDVGRHIERDLISESSAAASALDLDVVVLGAGPAGVACAAVLAKSGLRFSVLERNRTLATIRAFKPDLQLYSAVTGDPDNRSLLPYEECTAGELIESWQPVLDQLQLPIREKTTLTGVTKRAGVFEITLKDGEVIRSRRVVVAVGKLIQLEKLGAVEEKLDCREREHSVSKASEPTTSTECDVISRAGLRMERAMDLRGLSFMLAWVTGIVAMYLWLYYGETDASGRQIVPFTDLALPGWFIYSTAYTAIIWIFGIRAIRRWKSPLQTRKYSLLIASQTILFWGLPTFAFTRIAGFSTPASGYELGYIWPLAIKPENTAYWFNAGGWAYWMFAWNIALSFLLIPIITYKHGKKYCSWVCGCGGLAETLGDQWRHFSPKGKENTARERQGYFVTGFALIATVVILANVVFPGQKLLGQSSSWLARIYGGVVDVWLIGIIPVALYPFMGGKLWCRYWCPSAVYMQLFSRFWTRLKRPQGKPLAAVPESYGIFSRKERCIACNHCTRYCEVGVDVRKFAIKGVTFDNTNSSCIGCGICISVCPTETLSFDASFAGQVSHADDSVVAS